MVKGMGCSKVVGCTREAGHRGPHVGADGHKISKDAPPPAAASAAAIGLADLSKDDLDTLAERRLDNVIEAIEKFNPTNRGHAEAMGVVHAVREYDRFLTLIGRNVN